jgi:hypothetical protein
MKNYSGITAEILEKAINSPDAIILQEGRNLTVRTKLPLADGSEIDVAVKRFPPRSFIRKRLDSLRGVKGKAMRSFLAAKHLFERNPHSTPEPVCVIESDKSDSSGESWFVTRYVPDLASFRKKLIELYAASGPCPELMNLLKVVAEACARIHDSGFMHRDLGNQNIMLCYKGGKGNPRVMLVDLNRSRLHKGPLSTPQRARDISRIHLPSDFLRVFLEMYWRGAVPPKSFLKKERKCRRSYAFHAATRKIRHPFRKQTSDPDGEYPEPKDIWIWDPRSEQAIPAFRSRDRHKYQSITRITSPIAAIIKNIFRYEKNRQYLKKISFNRPIISFAERIFISISADPDRLDKELEWLAKIGCIGVHVRLYAHDSSAVTEFKKHAVRRLKNLNYAVTISLVQDRRTSANPELWEEFCCDILDSVRDIVMWVEYLHAINRVKWGIWNLNELEALLALLPSLSEKYRDVTFIAPSVIDFEWDYMAAALERFPADAKISALSTHLYVDRRGAPESYQGKFNALGKLQLLRAMALSCENFQENLIVSEFNWPLLGTREWSPVGSPYVSPGERKNDPSVSEKDAAIFTMRYIFIGLCSGMAESMVFWSLAAHGFGLVDPGTNPEAPWRGRPAFRALKFFFKLFRHGHYTKAILKGEKDAWMMQFVSGEGDNIAVAWSSSKTDAHEPLPPIPFKYSKVYNLYGEEIQKPASLGADPIYIT